MKCLYVYLAGCLAILLVNCNNSKDTAPSKPGVKDSNSKVLPDTVSGQKPTIQEGTMLDSASIPRNIHHLGIEMLMPVMNDHPWLQKHLTAFKEKSLRDFYDETKDDTTGTQDSVDYGEYMGIEPELVYRTDSLISIVLQRYWGMYMGTGAFEYQSFNYDNRRKKEIRFKDYFQLDTPADTASFVKVLVAEGGLNKEDSRRFLSLDPDIIFGFDKDNIHFCFEKYHLYYWGRGIMSIRKSVLINNIRPAYRN